MPRKPNPNRPLYASMIADAREKAGLTQSELGVAVGKDTSSIKKYEGGKVPPPFDVLFDICSFLNLDIFEVMGLDLKQGGSTGFHEYIDTPYNEFTSLLDKDINIAPLSDSGYTDNDISIVYNDHEGFTTKTDFILKSAAIRKRLQSEYQKKLAKELTQLAISIAEGTAKNK